MIRVPRRPDWPERLAAFLKAASERLFVWGETDCALNCADWVFDATGRDPAAVFRGTYTTARGSLIALHKYGAGDLESTATVMLGEPWRSARQAQRGDIVSVELETGVALAICAGRRSAVIHQDAGFIYLPTADALKAWPV